MTSGDSRPLLRKHGVRNARQRPHLLLIILFVLAMSGPPRLRVRGLTDSIRGEIDIVVILHVVVLALAALWVFDQLNRHWLTTHTSVRLWLPQKLGLMCLLLLSVSILVSEGKALTAYMVIHMAVGLLFAFFFVKRFGVEACLLQLLIGSMVLSIGIALAAYFAPSLVWYENLYLNYTILRGDAIGPTAAVTVFGIILLFGLTHHLPLSLRLALLPLFSVLFLLARNRTGYAIVGFVLLLSVIGLNRVTTWRRLGYSILCLAPVPILLGQGPVIVEWVLRDRSSIDSLSGRLGLWSYLIEVAWAKSPLIGLGYYSASRIYGPQHSQSGWGATAHSLFVEVFVGGGILGFTALLLFFVVLCLSALRVLTARPDRIAVTVCLLFLSVVLFLALGWTNPGPVLFVLWCVTAMIPALEDRRSAGGRV